MSSAVSPLAPRKQPALPPIDGLRIATAQAGIKYKGRTDLLVMVFDEGTRVAGVLTRSKCPSAPVDFCRDNLPGGNARVLVVNSGNANAFTGRKGREATTLTASAAAAATGCATGEVFLASTGVIGEPLDAARFTDLLEGMARDAAPDRWAEAGLAIMTTDTYPKYATATVRLGDGDVTINGIAKGAGMIAPDMATMLSFVATDAPIAAPVLQRLLARGVGKTFNSVTVDSDTSTSDTLLVFATGAAAARGAAPIEDEKDPRLAGFRRAFNRILKNLAHQVVRDGEGARKEIEITVTGAKSSRSARRIALSIANSPLVKTAVAGEDANWGRVVMAVGKATVWTCDLTKEYVAINGDYRS
jgi:glutamate N-acetyltransferase/amino-acid N-acetyltransferase